MAFFHDDKDSFNQLKNDVWLGDNPQHCHTPDSVRESAAEELKSRGFSDREITYLKNRDDRW